MTDALNAFKAIKTEVQTMIDEIDHQGIADGYTAKHALDDILDKLDFYIDQEQEKLAVAGQDMYENGH